MSARVVTGRVGVLVVVALAGLLALGAGSALASALASTEAASAVSRTGAALHGTVSPGGEEVTSCDFEYGETEAYGHVSACAPAAPYAGSSSPVAVSAQITGLTPGVSYDYRVVAKGAGGSSVGGNGAFTTSAAVSGVSSEAASSVGLSGKNIVATLNGSLEPEGVETHYYFEYGETPAYGSIVPALPGTATSATGTVHAQEQISGLQPYAIYHYRLVAVNSFGTTHGEDATFSTQSLVAPLLASILPATGVSQFAATLNGTLETDGAVTNYHFEYGTTTAYGQFAPDPDDYTPLVGEPIATSQPVDGLRADTTYHYRLVASSPGGTDIESPDQTFTTLSIPAPTVATGGPSGVGVGQATLSGTVDPHGWDTQYLFEYGTSTAYGQSWPTVPVEMGALEGSQPVIVNIPNPQLLPGTTYHYRLVAIDVGGTSYGQDVTLTTGSYPVEPILEPAIAGTLLVPSEAGKITTVNPKKGKKKGKRMIVRHRAKHGRARRGHKK